MPHPAIFDAIRSENNPCFESESKCETDKAEGFADDTSVATIFSFDSLNSLKIILERFATFSGLKCNMEKTSIMQIGNITPVPDQVRDLGFSLCDETKILGMNISAEPDRWNTNFETILTNIRKKIEFWNRFNLTLPGRICVIKSLLISPLSHLGSFLMPTKPMLNTIQKTLDSFAKGKLNVAVSKITVPVEAGGLGLFNVEEFLMAQQCCWIFRTIKSVRDNWRNDVYELSFGNPLSFSPKTVDIIRHPILHHIACSFERLRIKFDKKNENYLTSSIFYNPILFRETRDKRPLCPTYLGVNNDIMLTYKLATCQLQDLCGDYGILSHEELFSNGINLTALGYGRLSNALNCFFDRLRPDRDDTENSKTLVAAFGHLKKPGRKCRIFLASGRNDDISKQTTCKTFFRLLNINYIGNKEFSIPISWWNTNCLPNRVRTFAFKFFNNILGLNQRTVHFAVNPVRYCIFCHLDRVVNPPDESFFHLFSSCPTVRQWHMEFLRTHFNNLNLVDDEVQKFWFLGILPNQTTPSFAVLSAVMVFQYCIWEEKLRKRKPAFRTVNVLLEDIFLRSFAKNKIFAKSAATLHYAIFRTTRGLYGPPH